MCRPGQTSQTPKSRSLPPPPTYAASIMHQLNSSNTRAWAARSSAAPCPCCCCARGYQPEEGSSVPQAAGPCSCGISPSRPPVHSPGGSVLRRCRGTRWCRRAVPGCCSCRNSLRRDQLRPLACLDPLDGCKQHTQCVGPRPRTALHSAAAKTTTQVTCDAPIGTQNKHQDG
jgi:hypothetical protein